MPNKSLFLAIKRITRPNGVQLPIPVDGFPRFFLRPVCCDTPAPGDVACLTKWRNQYVKSFLTEFEATEDRTRNWLSQQVASDETRILFMIDSSENVTYGYVGIAHINWQTGYFEADSIVRGLPTSPGLMAASVLTLIAWAQQQLQLGGVGVRVLSDNPALAFYRKIGFVEQQRFPLRCTDSKNLRSWEIAPEISSPARELIMHIKK